MDSRRRNSKDQESKVAKELSGRVTPASGALWGTKGDVRNDIYLVECKTTTKDFYSLTFTTWDKIYREAIKDGLRIPLMCIDLKNGRERYAVMSALDVPDEIIRSIPVPPIDGITSSLRVKGVCRRFISNKVKTYDLVVIEWDRFLSEVNNSE